ncbi:hypothetical protein AB0I60_26560 [Actinosynnema sp. NPDC050436]|uniref:hypothetical protein n=1 Tax=Actinosynnema sp. NPDC050436 TaxID=3155659 RepID=UPI0033E17691
MIVDPAGARDALRAGAAVVLPNPAPLTHVVAATTPQAVNGTKGRPLDQAVAVWAHHPGTLAAVTASDPGLAVVARRLLVEERVTLLVPVHAVPAWLAPATRDGWALLFGARWEAVLPVLDPFPVLYVSSANRTGGEPVATTADALTTFSADTPVLDLPDEEAGPVRRATTTLRLHPDGHLELHRRGAQDDLHDDPADYLHHVRTRVLSSAEKRR